MSYEYARIPLKPGLNIICGPNGSGKSSVLLAISVAMGLTYTERSRKLSDLVRWGKDSARISLVFDNTLKNGKRPVPRFDIDFFRVSRYLQKDGNYWFEANFESVTKNEITTILDRFGLDPDNMLTVMHQNTMEEFSLTSPTQKLTMFEEAIGLAKHRQNIIEGQRKLMQVLSEEESINNLLETAEQTLAYWKSEYERYQQQQELLTKKTGLIRELRWAKVILQQHVVQLWKTNFARKEAALKILRNDLNETRQSIETLHNTMKAFQYEQRQIMFTLTNFEKAKTEHETIEKIQIETQQRVSIIKSYFKQTQQQSTRLSQIIRYIEEVKDQIVFSKKRLEDVKTRIFKTQKELTTIDEKLNAITNKYVDSRVREGILDFQIDVVQNELETIKTDLLALQKDLELLQSLVSEDYQPIKTQRNPQQVSEDLKITNVKLASLSEVSTEVQKMYTTYLNLFNEMKEKAKTVAANRANTLREIENRKQMWRRLLQSTLDEVGATYRKFLNRIDATGSLRLVDALDLEAAGLELIVGFKGAAPQILDAYTQSGGERSAATMAFLLALQQHLKSSFRAVDEFDIHMDPRNREVISDMLLEEISKHQDIQYITITPGQITSLKENVHIITVQNISGKSEVKVISNV
jgi:chromosome segregation protein